MKLMRFRELAAVMAIASFVLGFACMADAAEKETRGASQFTVPAWFKNSFLDLKEDAVEAATHGRRLLVYIGQDGCPYCAALFKGNFGRKDIADYTKAHFDAIEINLWGDRPVTDFSGEALTEKTFATKHGVRYTPTILIFDGRGRQLLRINGYYPPDQFMAALRYAAEDHLKAEPFAAYLARVAPKAEKGALRKQDFFEAAPYDLRARPPGKPIAVFFEQKNCGECESLHGIFAQPATLEQIRRFRVVQLDRWSDTPLTTPQGTQTTARAWADRLNVSYVPTAVLFDGGKEVIRIESMLKGFHVQSAMDYVASGAHRNQPSFQRFIQGRADRLRERGVTVDLWK